MKDTKAPQRQQTTAGKPSRRSGRSQRSATKAEVPAMSQEQGKVLFDAVANDNSKAITLGTPVVVDDPVHQQPALTQPPLESAELEVQANAVEDIDAVVDSSLENNQSMDRIIEQAIDNMAHAGDNPGAIYHSTKMLECDMLLEAMCDYRIRADALPKKEPCRIGWF